MKVAFVVSQFPTLSESFVVQQIIDLLECGHDVRIFAEKRSDQLVIQKEIEEYGLLAKTVYIVKPSKKWLLRLKGAYEIITCFLSSPAVTLRPHRKWRNH